jgi:transportin-1
MPGCIDHLTPHLGELVTWLIGTLQHKKSLVRSITCWTLGRYSSWIVSAAASKEQHFIPTMEGVSLVIDLPLMTAITNCS